MSKKVLGLASYLETIPVVLTDKDGVEKKYSLKELVGNARNLYLDTVKDRVIVDSEGEAIGMKTFKGMQSDLLSKCFYDSEDKLVSLDSIEDLPSSTQLTLYTEARILSALDTKEKEEIEKKD